MKPGPKPTLPQARWPGIYAIVNLLNDKRYVGSALSVTGRLNSHRKALRAGRHINPHLQSAWNKYGEKAFSLIVIEPCPPHLLVEREQHWIDTFKAADRQYGYNKCPVAGNMLGFRHSEESKRKMSETRKGFIHPNMTKAAADYWRGKSLPKHVLDAAAAVNRVRMRQPKSDETKARMREAALRRWQRAKHGTTA